MPGDHGADGAPQRTRNLGFAMEALLSRLFEWRHVVLAWTSVAAAPLSKVVTSMEPNEIVQVLIESDGPVDIEALIEASVHLPRRGNRWVAAFRDSSGRRAWRTTGLRDRRAALALATEWEAKARRGQVVQPPSPGKTTIRVRPGSAERAVGMLSQAEVAAIMRISERTVRAIEKRAIEKLRRHPVLRDLWREWKTGGIKEVALAGRSDWALTRAEAAAVYALARTPEERQALRKLFALTQDSSR